MIARIKAWWAYSRVIFLNVAIAILAIASELIQFATGFDWTQILPAKTAGVVVIIVNVLNIVLRFSTSGPVGSRRDGVV